MDRGIDAESETSRNRPGPYLIARRVEAVLSFDFSHLDCMHLEGLRGWSWPSV